jgi:hypothetical protein
VDKEKAKAVSPGTRAMLELVENADPHDEGLPFIVTETALRLGVELIAELRALRLAIEAGD